ncbi:MAG: 4-(cytidine 5'-diphospho)-2-C-methyl-D-erythritol kinase [Acidimicrobiia bacterium]|nr:4-(cytidine 5'-diphospho)-2-C-methyl-D-erythritol kinase [Acidimicrobiia bacterium]
MRVLGRRDDGYHDIDALVVSIRDPHDVVEVEAVPHPGGVTFLVEGEVGDVPTGSENLAMRAGETVMLRAGRSGHGVRMTLRKKIPAGAGLGGGSADAAAAMGAVRRMLELELSDAEMLEIGAELGSDVPFCLTGGAAWIRGRGELLEPVDLPAGLPYLVAIPPFRLSTPAVYAAWDELGGPRTRRRVPAFGPVAALLPELSNDLEPAAEAVEPRLVEFRETLERLVGVPALLAGSGSAYVVPVPDDKVGRIDAVAKKVRRALKVTVATSQTVNQGVRLSSG